MGGTTGRSDGAMNRATALLVDDDAKLGRLLAEYLGKNDVDLTIAPDGQRGLAALTARPFDVVLLDQMLPHLDGLDVCRPTRAGLREAVPAILPTARVADQGT